MAVYVRGSLSADLRPGVTQGRSVLRRNPEAQQRAQTSQGNERVHLLDERRKSGLKGSGISPSRKPSAQEALQGSECGRGHPWEQHSVLSGVRS